MKKYLGGGWHVDKTEDPGFSTTDEKYLFYYWK
jgi:hypothetical protein